MVLVLKRVTKPYIDDMPVDETQVIAAEIVAHLKMLRPVTKLPETHVGGTALMRIVSAELCIEFP